MAIPAEWLGLCQWTMNMNRQWFLNQHQANEDKEQQEPILRPCLVFITTNVHPRFHRCLKKERFTPKKKDGYTKKEINKI